jgi:hypothetical protein
LASQPRGLSHFKPLSPCARRKNAMVAKTTSRKTESLKVDPAEFTRLGNEKEFSALIEQATQEWLARVEKERLFAADLAAKLSTVRSPLDIGKIYQEWLTHRMQMIAEDSRYFVENGQRVMNSSLQLLSNGWHQARPSR